MPDRCHGLALGLKRNAMMMRRTIQTLLAATAILALVSCKGGGTSQEAQIPKPTGDGPATVIFLTGLLGTTEPCGCTSAPLGGLDKVAMEIEAIRKEGPTALFIVGDTFFEEFLIPPHRRSQEIKKAEAIAEVLARLKPDGIVTGTVESGPNGETLKVLAERFKLPIFSGPRTVEPRLRSDSVLKVLGNLKLGFVGISGEPFSEGPAYMAGGVSLQAQGADFVVGLMPVGGYSGRVFAERLGGLNLMVGGGSEEGLEPLATDGPLFAEAGEKGQYLGILRLHRNGVAKGEELAWVYDDQGRVEKAQIQVRIDRLQGAVERMEDGPGKAARQKKLQELVEKQRTLKTPVPNGPYVTWESRKITHKHPKAAWATTILADYNRSLCGITQEATAQLSCPPAAQPQHAYVGTAQCAACHPNAQKAWSESAHAKAWQTLTSAGKECDLGCIGCHTVGYQKPGGFCRVVDAPKHANVGCENCHGPGAGHTQNPGDRTQWGALFVASPQESLCTSCHNPEHSDTFEWQSYRQEIVVPGHGLPVSAPSAP